MYSLFVSAPGRTDSECENEHGFLAVISCYSPHVYRLALSLNCCGPDLTASPPPPAGTNKPREQSQSEQSFQERSRGGTGCIGAAERVGFSGLAELRGCEGLV